MNIYFISGHLDLTEEEFKKHYSSRIERAIAEGSSFIVGDARGADKLAQQFLKSKTEKVTVYHMYTSPRNNAGFTTEGGFISDSSRDRCMTENSTDDIAWVKPGRENSGTARNLARRK